MNKKYKLAYDIQSLPTGLSIDMFIKVMEQHGTVFYDSEKGGLKPRIYLGDDASAKDESLLLVDAKGKEIDIDQFQKDFEFTEKWEKEMHYCKTSANYYFKNFGATKYPVTIDDEREYLKSIGLADISNEKDSDTAADLWAKQKEKTKDALKHITLEHLQERAIAMECLKAEYFENVTKIEAELKDFVKLHDKRGDLLPENQRIQNLVGRIKAVNPIPKSMGSFRNKKGKWDHQMLILSSYDSLLNIYKEIR